MATHEPNNWRMPPNVLVDSYAEIWADEILPIAREAHARVEFEMSQPQQEDDRIVAAGEQSKNRPPIKDFIAFGQLT